MESTPWVPVPDPPPPPAHRTGRRGLGSRYRGGRGSRYRGGRRYCGGHGTPPLPRNSGSGLSGAGDEGVDQGGVDQGRADQEWPRCRGRGRGGRGGRLARGGAGRGRVHHNGARGRGFRGQRRGGPGRWRDRRPYASFIRVEGGADSIQLLLWIISFFINNAYRYRSQVKTVR